MKRILKIIIAGTMIGMAFLTSCNSTKKATTDTSATETESSNKIDINDENLSDYIESANVDIDNARYDSALDTLGKVLEVYPDNEEAKSLVERAKERMAEDDAAMYRHYRLAEARNFIDRGEYDEAIDIANELLALDSEDVEPKAILEEAKSKKSND